MKGYHDITEDGGAGILQQVGVQRARIAQALAGVRRRLAIGSGKGGVGKSTLVRQLASALAGDGRRVAVLDADLNGPSQARLAGMPAAPFLPGANGIALPRNREGIGVVSLGSLLPESTALEFPSVSTGEAHVWRATREFTLLGELLGSVEWGELDLLLLDLPPGAERTVQYADYFGRETAFVLVTIPTDLARGVVARSIAALRQTANPLLGYVENMQGYYCTGCGSVKPLFAPGAGVALELPCLGRIPFDPELAALSDRGGSLLEFPERPATRAVREAARAIGAALEEDR
ncbi:MAG TPA: P-loop NTPase [Candidatus Polarisedimenticolaceae bacterium]|nr:P-loop NTPase [Candidatus Polarisedimenticolaceae bacterium]